MDPLLTSAMQIAMRTLEWMGMLAIMGGVVIATLRYGMTFASEGAFRLYRRRVGLSILLGLELLVAADILNTVTLEPDLDSVIVLGAIVLIRTFLSFSLEVELEGELPWRRGYRRPNGDDSQKT